MSLAMLQNVGHLSRHIVKRCGALLTKCVNEIKHSTSLAYTSLFFIILLIVLINYYENRISQISSSERSDQALLRTLNEVNKVTVSDESRYTRLPDDTIVIYNRVPKTGSTSLMGITYELCAHNGFNVMHLNTSRNSHVMSLSDQLRFVWNVTRWTKRQPAFIHGHIAYLNFDKFGLFNPKPLYINLIRKPLDRLVSYYYFLRNGDNFRPNLVRKKQGDKRSFDECVELNDRDCRAENLWLQIPFFCGQDSECWKPGNRWALEQAKRNLLDHYFLVGVTENMQTFVQVLEAALPKMFAGANAVYEKGAKSHLRQTFNKSHPSPKTIAKMQQSRIWQMENEFYQFALDNFNFIKDHTLIRVKQDDGSIIYKDKGQQFFFEKIRPK